MHARISRWTRMAALAAAFLLPSCDDGPVGPDGGPRAPEGTGLLVYSTFDPAIGRWGVATANPDGSDAGPFPFSPANVGHPLPDLVFFEFQWSPDGERLLLRSSRTNTDDWAYAVVEADGTGKRFVTHPDGFALGGQWSPRGDRILYHRGGLVGDQLGIAFQTAIADLDGVTRDFFVVDDGQLFEGRRVHFSLIVLPDSSLWDPVPAIYEAAFAPDGESLYVLGSFGAPMWSTERRAVDTELFRVSVATGRILERLTFNEVDETGFQLSPDGRRLLLTRPLVPVNSGRELRLYTLDLTAGAELRRITSDFHEFARWASDSRHVTFVRPEDGEPAVWMVDADRPEEEWRVLGGGTGPDLHLF